MVGFGTSLDFFSNINGMGLEWNFQNSIRFCMSLECKF